MWLDEFENASTGAVEKETHDLVREDEADALTGVDFLITKVTIREGSARQPGGALEAAGGYAYGGYMSLELWVAPHQDYTVINRRRRASQMPPIDSIDALPFHPGEKLVINDGGTGIYRDVVHILADLGWIALRPGMGLAGNARSGSSAFDAIPAEWAGISQGIVITSGEAGEFTGYEANLKVRCRRGLRLSSYDYDGKGHMATTRYL
jgi:hypothetical protein